MTPYDATFNQAAAAYNVPPWLLEALARSESSLNPNQKVWEPKVGEYSYGLMGLLGSTARSLGYTGPLDDLKQPAINIALGAQYAAAIIAGQGALFLPNFYSEWNSGRPTAWQSSQEVYDHVRAFLMNVGTALNRPVMIGATIEDTLAQLATPPGAELSILVVAAVAAIALFAARR